nr:retrovirus-related Pol polyprotein from transposon TNT 1-94 [Tanacetum cinerariifolium]
LSYRLSYRDKLDLDQNGTLVDATKYRSMIGALMYLMSSRPDIVHATCLCARYQAKPTKKHLKEVKRIFHYLRGTVNTGLWYTKDSGFDLIGFLDADYAGCKDSFKSTSGGAQFLDSGFELIGFSDADYAGCKDTFKSTFGGAQFLREKLVSWSSKKQDCTALSTMKAKYVSLSACYAQVLWMQTQLTDYGFHFNKIPIYCDSKSAIAISCNPVQHLRTKHIAVRYHFIKEHVEKGTIELYFFKTDYQLADIFTTALPTDRFNYLVCHLGMRSLSPKELERLYKRKAIRFGDCGRLLSLHVEFKNQVLKEYFDTVGISHQMSSVQTPQQNGVVERRNQTLVEAARTMLIFSRASLFLWAETKLIYKKTEARKGPFAALSVFPSSEI